MRKFQISVLVILSISGVISCSLSTDQNHHCAYNTCTPSDINMYGKDKNGRILGFIGNNMQSSECHDMQLTSAKNGGMNCHKSGEKTWIGVLV